MKRILFSIVCISLLLTGCADKNAQLIQAAKNGNLPAVKTALAKGAAPNAKDKGGVPVLMWAAQNGHTEVVKLLLENGADVNVKRTNTGTTALWIASQNGHTEVVKLLLEKGADVNVKRTTDGTTALYVASQNGHTEVVKLLLEKGADVNVKKTDTGTTALMIASQNGHTKVVKLLSEKVVVVPENYPRIQAAIDAAESGTVIHIKPGDYKETLSLKSGVSLKGLNSNGVVIHCDILEGPVLTVDDCNGMKISGLTLKHTGQGKMPADFEGRFPVLLLKSSRAAVTRCKIQNSGGNGIVVNGGNSEIRECNVSNNKLSGILIYGGAKVVLKKNNCCQNGGNGIYFIAAASDDVSENTCNENVYNGISVENDQTIINLFQNTCAINKGSGIYFSSGAKGNARGNICQANAYNGIVVTNGGTNAALEENVTTGNKVNGILFADRAAGSVIGNKCSENLWHGISVGDDWSTPKIDKNSCLNNKKCGLYLGESFRAKVSNNDIRDNGETSYGEVINLLWKNNLSELDSIASRLRTEKRRYANGNWQLSYFYEALGEGWAGRWDFSQTKDQLEKWISQKPNSITPRIALARAYKVFAWQARGNGYANEVSEKSWVVFKENLHKAERILIEAKDLNTPDPDLYVTWLVVGRGLEKSNEEMDSLFERGIAIEKNYWLLYTTRALAIAPIWGGQQGQFEAFARRAVELTRQQEGHALYAKIAHTMIGKYEPNQYKKLDFSYELLQQSHDDLVRLYPDANDNYLLNASCFLACVFNDREKAKDFFARIGANWDKEVWRSEKVMNRYRDWAFGKIEDVPD